MNILYTLNDKFVPQVGASICSVCENNSDSNITFYLISMGVSDRNKKELIKFVHNYKQSINIIELDDLNKYFNFKFDTNGWNPIVLARLLVDKILPNIDRVLYLDGDIIVRGSLKKLWNHNMQGKVIAMSIEPTVDKTRKKNLGLEYSHYYNAGVLLIDLKKWCKDDTGKKIIDYYRVNKGKLFANDQDAINATLKDNIETLSPKYNFYNIFNQYPYWYLRKLEKPADYLSKDVIEEAIKEPVIIHYLGEERPWRKYNTHKYKDDYIKYLNMTPWSNTPLEDGWCKYFICWKIFNVVTKPFPAIRYHIINSLIPVMMKKRSNKLKKIGEK